MTTQNRTQKIAFFSDLGQGGASRQVVETSVLLSQKGHTVTIYTYDLAKAFYQVKSSVQVVDLQGKSTAHLALFDRVLAILRLKRQIRTAQPDVVLSYTTVLNISLGLVGWMLGRKRRPLLIGSERNRVLRYNESQLWAIICRLAYKGLDGISSNSREAIETIQSILKYPRTRTYYLPNLLDVDYFSPAEPVLKADKPFTVLIPARITAQKNQKILVDVASRLKAKQIQVVFVLAGLQDEPYTSELISNIKKNQVTEYFDLIGRQEDIKTFYLKSDLVCLLSHFEGLSNSMLEALSCGSLFLGSTIPEFAHFIEDSVNGFLVDPDSPQSICDKIISIMKLEPSIQGSIRQQARNKALYFGSDAYYARFFELINKIQGAKLK